MYSHTCGKSMDQPGKVARNLYLNRQNCRRNILNCLGENGRNIGAYSRIYVW